jgi:alpha-beta hydrolase superfamily lysophospholipase
MHDWISVRMFFEVEAAGKRLMEGGWRSKHPIFLAHGNADPVTSAEASRQFWDRLQVADGSAIQFYEGMLHELWNERAREMFLGQILGWMDVRSARFFAGDRKSGSP